MIYIEIDQESKVIFTHNQPFDAVNGFGKTKEELLKTGYLVESVPNAEIKEGFTVNTFYNPTKKEFSFKYSAIPQLIEDELFQIQLALAELTQANEDDKTETQLAIAELANLISGGNA